MAEHDGKKKKRRKDGQFADGGRARRRLDRAPAPGRIAALTTSPRVASLDRTADRPEPPPYKKGGRIASIAREAREEGESYEHEAAEHGRARGGKTGKFYGATFKSGGRLTYGERQKMPSSQFALPGHGAGPKGKGGGSYPIPDEAHGRNALARVAQHGSPSEKARVRAAVHRKFPNIGKR